MSQRWGKLWERCGNPNSFPKFTQRRKRLRSALCLPALVHFCSYPSRYFSKNLSFQEKKNDNLPFMKAGERWLSIFFNIFYYLSNLTVWPNAPKCRGSSCPSFQQEGSNNSPLVAQSKKLCQPFGFSCLLFSLIKTFWGSIPDFLVSLSFADVAKVKRTPGACFSSGVSEASCTTGTFWKQNKLKEEIPQLKEFAASFTGAWQVKSIPHVKFSSLCLVLQDVRTLL